MLNRRAFVVVTVISGPAALVGCEGGLTGAASPTATAAAASPSPQPFQIRVQMIPQEARLGTDENVVVRTTFLRLTGGQMRPVGGAQIVAVASYPAGPQTFTSDVTTFSDGRAPDLLIPVAPARGASTVRVEVTMKFQGQDFKQAAGFTVR